MRYLVMVLLVGIQMIISSVALAWSPLESYESAIESMRQCYLVTASDEDSQEGKKEEEEEEPDCD